MKIKNAIFIKSCTKSRDYPVTGHPEIAFLGRSNAGKSSLINMLVNRKDLVKTGAKPGVTKTINFFLLNDMVSVADLPGYGYAKLPMEMRKTFLPMIREYIGNRTTLKLAFLLMDIRRTPDDFDHDLIRFIIERKVPVALVLTKSDKLTRNQRKRRIEEIRDEFGVNGDSIFPTSSHTGEGKRELLAIIDQFCLTRAASSGPADGEPTAVSSGT